MEQLPGDVDVLIDQLDEAFPERCPDPKASEREIWMATGARQVVRLLLALRRDRDKEHDV